MKNKLLAKLDNHTVEAVKSSFPSLLIKILGMVATLVGSVLMGRTLGVEGYGILELANRIGSFALVFSTFGLQYIVLKEIAIGFDKKNWHSIKNIMYTSLKFTGILGGVVCGALIVLSPFLSKWVFEIGDLSLPLQIIMAGVFFQTLSRSYMSGINGFGKIWQSNLGDQTLGMVLVLLVYTLLIALDLMSVVNASLAFLIARGIVALVFGVYWEKIKQKVVAVAVFRKELLKPAARLLLASGSGIVSASAATIILGIMSTATEVGLYNLAARLSLLTLLIIQITNSALAPKIAALFASGKKEELQKLLFNFTIILSLVGLCSWVCFLIFGNPVIRLWGDGFEGAYIYLLVLAFGQMVSTSGGAIGITLMMTNNEKIIGKIALSFMLLSIILNIVFINYFGGLGACVATALCAIGETLTRLIILKRTTGINLLNSEY